MAGEEDNELRDLVAQALEAKGILGRIRAELRSSVFQVLEEQEKKKEGARPRALRNQKLQSFLATKDGQTVTGLVREFMEFFDLDFSCAVFDPETNVLDTYSGRDRLASDVGADGQMDSPLLLQLLKRPKATPTKPDETQATPSITTSFEPIPPSASFTDGGVGGVTHSRGGSDVTTALGMKQLTEDLLKSSGRNNPPKDTSTTDKEDKIAKLLHGRETERQQERDKARLESGGTHTPTSDTSEGSRSGTEKDSTKDGDSPDDTSRRKGVETKDSKPPEDGARGGGGEGNGSDDEYSGKYETSDHSLSQLSGGVGDFDYTEEAQQ